MNDDSNDNSPSGKEPEKEQEKKISSQDKQDPANDLTQVSNQETSNSLLSNSADSNFNQQGTTNQQPAPTPTSANTESANDSTNTTTTNSTVSPSDIAVPETGTTLKKPRILREYNREILEAAFFVAGRPLSTRHLAQEFGANTREIRQITRSLSNSLRKYQGELQLDQLEYDSDYWVLHLEIDDKHLELLQNLLVSDIPKSVLHAPLTKAVLTAVAFLQPCSQARVFKILSKQGGFVITTTQIEQELERLSKEGLIIANVAKSPIQFETTKRFAIEFGFEELSRVKLRNQLARWLGATDEEVEQSEPAEE